MDGKGLGGCDWGDIAKAGAGAAQHSEAERKAINRQRENSGKKITQSKDCSACKNREARAVFFKYSAAEEKSEGKTDMIDRIRYLRERRGETVFRNEFP